MRFSSWIGIAAAVVLLVSCFMNWAWYPDIHQYFTGFVSKNNVYGKPGKIFFFFATISVIFFLVPRIWAKRFNLFVCALILAYAINSFIRFSGCYRGICPERQAGLWLMLIGAALMMVAALFPDLKLKESSEVNSDK